jgi:hypothetical protein
MGKREGRKDRKEREKGYGDMREWAGMKEKWEKRQDRKRKRKKEGN